MQLAVVWIHYHGATFLQRSIDAVRKDLAGCGLEADLLVVDNGSSQKERALLAESPARYLDAGSNRGYAGGINLGVAHTEAPFLAVMNPDVEVSPGCLGALLQSLRAGAAAVGPRFFWDRQKTFLLPPTEQRGRGNEVLATLASRGAPWDRYARQRWRRHARRHWTAQSGMTSHTLSGALLGFQRDAVGRVGPFDEGFKLYFEETDWLMRLRKRGMPALYEPSAHAVHLYNQSAAHESGAAGWFGESELRFRRRYYGAWFPAFLGRLAGRGRNPAVPRAEPLPAGVPVVAWRPVNPDPAHPVWVEVSPSPLGFPAAGARFATAGCGFFRLPGDIWEHLMPGTYFLQTCDHGGREVCRYSFVRGSGCTDSGASTDIRC